jgi:hypothetical protein
MTQKQNPITDKKPSWILTIAIVLSVIILTVLTWVYHYEPLSEVFSPQWNLLAIDFLILIPALAAAILGIILTCHFKPGEQPFLIWLIFTLGWWAWVAGEVSGIIHDIWLYDVPYPELTIIDLFWTLGYLCFILSLFLQYRLIYGRGKKIGIVYYIAIIGITLLLTLGFTQWALKAGLGEDISWFALYLAIFYPVCDVVAGIAALWLSFLFGRGLWGRPWWGLIAFAIADSINIFTWIGGDRLLSEKAYITLDLIASIAYTAGYIIVAIGFLLNHLIIQYGPSSLPQFATGATPTRPR